MALKKMLILCLVMIFFIYNSRQAEAAAPVISANASVLMDAGTGQILFEKKGFVRREPASLTKIMTAVIALEYDHLDDIVKISKKTANISVGQDLGLARDDCISLENLIKAALMYSANDSTVAIAEHISGTEEKFVGLMNSKALVLGMMDTQFTNTNGYHHPQHNTTAYDLAKLTRYALSNSKFAQIVGTAEDIITWYNEKKPGVKKEKNLKNTNRLVREKKPGILGVKTGTTIRAGNCLIAAARQGDRTLIAVLLHSRNRYNDALKLFDYGFNRMVPSTLCGKGEHCGNVPVTGGTLENVPAVPEKEIILCLAEGDRGRVVRKISLESSLAAPVPQGQKIGEMVFTLHGKEIARTGLVAGMNVPRQGMLFKLRKIFEE